MEVKRRMWPLLGTFVEVAVAADTDRADWAINRAFESVGRIQGLMSFHDPDSELSRLNRADGAEISLHPHTATVLSRALRLGRSSGELFNCTVGGSLVKTGVLPDHGNGQALDVGCSGDILLAGCRAKLLRPLRITLDGIAKGYAVDCAVRTLQRCGARGGWVNAGGDLRVFGAMALPVSRRGVDGSLAAIGQLRNCSMATSAVHAEPDPDFPGCLVESGGGNVSPGCWSVLAPSAWMADALTKVAGLLGESGRREAVALFGGQLVAAS